MEGASAMRIVGNNCGDPAKEAEFNDWYTNDHILFLMRSRFVIGAERYQRIGDDEKYPKYLAIYWCENEKALDNYVKDPIRKAAREERFKCWPTEGDFVAIWRVSYKQIAKWGNMDDSLVWRICGTNCAPTKEAKFNDWYTNHHVPIVMRSPLVTAAERYQREGDNDEYPADLFPQLINATEYPKYVAIYGLKDEKTLNDYLNSPSPRTALKDRLDTWSKDEEFTQPWLVNYKRIARRRK